MMLRYAFNLTKEADAIEKAIEEVLEDGFRTVDILSLIHILQIKYYIF